MNLFATTPGKKKESTPLADRMRPRTLDEFIGQEHLLAPGKPLRHQIERDEISSMILWGPPGCGKTTLAQIIAHMTQSEFVPFSAVLSGIAEIRKVMERAEHSREMGRRTIVFVDEVHRFNKAQQDAFLPWVERGSIVLIGATTENPSFEVIGPLLSRTKVYMLRALDSSQLVTLLHRALADAERGLGDRAEYGEIVADEDLLQLIATYANGDARSAYNTIEAAVLRATPDAEGRRVLSRPLVEDVLQRKVLLYDKTGEEHFNLISALHKSVRNSDPDATLYWLTRMLESGEDPLYLARRLVRMASEDVGLADPGALRIAIAAMQAADFVGPPEGNLALAEAAVYLALAPKSNALYTAYGAVQKDLSETVAEPVPLHLRNAVTRLMKESGYGHGYKYAHDFEEKTTDMPCLPDSLLGRRYYRPTNEGYEAQLQKRIEEWRRRRARAEKPQP
ncbi:MAG: replication-associated recombination protein A [Acidobacteriota bacterium]|nr:replication-associated recombination protein A [Acidobacteriota bacterium]